MMSKQLTRIASCTQWLTLGLVYAGVVAAICAALVAATQSAGAVDTPPPASSNPAAGSHSAAGSHAAAGSEPDSDSQLVVNKPEGSEPGSCITAENNQGLTRDQKDAATSAQKKGAAVLGANPLNGFSTTFSSGATLATASILNAYMKAWRLHGNEPACNLWNSMSLEVSATAAATTSSFTDYAKAEYLGLRNGLINIYFNPLAGRDANLSALQWNGRDLASDHIYMKSIFTPISVDDSAMASDQLLMYYLLGIGGRGVKTVQNGSTLAPIGTAYIGFGWDAPLHGSDSTAAPVSATDQSSWGGVSLSFFAAANVANHNTLAQVFEPNASAAAVSALGSTYETAGAALTLWMPAKLYFKLEYNKGLGSAGRLMGDTTYLSFGYGSSTTATDSNGTTKNGVQKTQLQSSSAQPSDSQ